jgi:hypothetical protein
LGESAAARNVISGNGANRAEAWWRAFQQAEAVGMAGQRRLALFGGQGKRSAD